MKQFCVFSIVLFVSIVSFAQNKDIVGSWKIIKFDVEVKTNYPLLSKGIEDKFKLKDTSDLIIKFADDGYVYQNDEDEVQYRIKNDSILFDYIGGVFTIQENILTIIFNNTHKFSEDVERLDQYDLDEYEIEDRKSIVIENLSIITKFKRCDTIALAPHSVQIDISDRLVKASPDNELVADFEEQIDPNTPLEPFINPEQMPAFKGGTEAMFKFINDHIQYPEWVKQKGVNERVIVKFVVQPDGKLSDVRIMRSDNAELNQEAIRLINLMPNWIPGKQNGETVQAYYTLPILFKLPAPTTK